MILRLGRRGREFKFRRSHHNHHLIIKLLHSIVAEQWRRVRVMTLKWSKLIGSELRHVFINSLTAWINEIWKAGCCFDHRNFPCCTWNYSIRPIPLFCLDWNIVVFWNQNVCGKEKTINWKRCRGGNLYGMRLSNIW